MEVPDMKERKMTKKDFVRRAMEVMLEYYDARIPATGRCKPFSVSADWPGTDYKARLMVEQDLTGSPDSRRLRTMMHENGSDRVVSHYITKGTGDELKAWLRNPENRGELMKSYEQLKQSVDNFD